MMTNVGAFLVGVGLGAGFMAFLFWLAVRYLRRMEDQITNDWR